jgi:hypothetical protein
MADEPNTEPTTDDAPIPNATLTSVFDIDDGAVVPLATMALEDAGIEYAIRAANMIIPGVIRGSEHTVYDKLVPGEILVRADDAPRARDLLNDLHQAPTIDPRANEPTPAEWAAPAASPSGDNVE